MGSIPSAPTNRMNKDIKKFYISYLTKENDQVNINQTRNIIELDEFFVVDQTIGWNQNIYIIISNGIMFLERYTTIDWDQQKVLKKLDNIKKEKQDEH